jgi:L-ascorbate metabolism protein UlaG (beta-lactamase superfamily)
MVINWYGEGSFKIQSGPLVILTDPFESGVGLTAPRFKSDLILKTAVEKAYISEKSSDARAIAGPGEYEVKGVEVRGYPAAHKIMGDAAVYRIKLEDMSLGILGPLASADLADAALENLSDLEILFVPAGGAPAMPPAEAAKLVKKLEPRLVIPCFFKVPGLKRPAESPDAFAKALGIAPTTEEKLAIKMKDIAWEGTRLITLKI